MSNIDLNLFLCPSFLFVNIAELIAADIFLLFLYLMLIKLLPLSNKSLHVSILLFSLTSLISFLLLIYPHKEPLIKYTHLAENLVIP